MPPLRLYLFASLIFFIWFTATQSISIPDMTEQDMQELAEAREEVQKSISGQALSDKMKEKFDSPESFVASFNTWLPRVFLLGVPLLAIATKLVFIKRGFVYLEHIILSMHLQTFLLLWPILLALCEWLIGLASPITGGIVYDVFIWWIQIYPVIALRRIFELTWFWAIVSTLLLELVFFLMCILGLVAVFVLSFFFG